MVIGAVAGVAYKCSSEDEIVKDSVVDVNDDCEI